MDKKKTTSFKKIKKIIKNSIKTNEEKEELFKFVKNSMIYQTLWIDKGIYFSDQILFDLCLEFKILELKKNKVIFKENTSENLNFFYIQKGIVGIFKLQKDKKCPKKNKKKLNINNNLSKINENNNIDFEPKYGKLIKMLMPGKSFGENALINNNKKRTASVITLKNSIFLVLSKKIFDKYLNDYYKYVKYIKKNWLSFSLNLRKKTSSFLFDKVFNSLNLLKINYKKNIIKEGEEIKGWYIIYEGEFLMTKKIKKNEIIKNLNLDNINSKKIIYTPKITLENLVKTNYFGEEYLFGIKNFSYNIEKIKNNSKLFFISYSDLNNSNSIYLKLLSELLANNYNKKMNKWNKNINNSINNLSINKIEILPKINVNLYNNKFNFRAFKKIHYKNSNFKIKSFKKSSINDDIINLNSNLKKRKKMMNFSVDKNNKFKKSLMLKKVYKSFKKLGNEIKNDKFSLKKILKENYNLINK